MEYEKMSLKQKMKLKANLSEKSAFKKLAEKKQKAVPVHECQGCEVSERNAQLSLENGEWLCQTCIAVNDERTKLHREIGGLKLSNQVLIGSLALMGKSFMEVHDLLVPASLPFDPGTMKIGIIESIKHLKNILTLAARLTAFDCKNSSRVDALRRIAIDAGKHIASENPS